MAGWETYLRTDMQYVPYTDSTVFAPDYPPGNSPFVQPVAMPAREPLTVNCPACQMRQSPPKGDGVAWECVKCGSSL